MVATVRAACQTYWKASTPRKATITNQILNRVFLSMAPPISGCSGHSTASGDPGRLPLKADIDVRRDRQRHWAIERTQRCPDFLQPRRLILERRFVLGRLDAERVPFPGLQDLAL